MKVLLISGNHPRHRFLATQLNNHGLLHEWIMEDRGPISSSISDNASKKMLTLTSVHFKNRIESENKYFPYDKTITADMQVFKSELNSRATQTLLSESSSDVLLTYGCHIISDTLLDSFQGAYKWNLHGGLSPWYKGTITLFWPSYMLQPNHTGMTLHSLSNKIDGGEIIHHSLTSLDAEDGIHDTANKAIINSFKDLIEIITHARSNDIKTKEQKVSGKLWINKDWSIYHVDHIYNYYNNRIVKYCLDNNINLEKPSYLVDQFQI